MADEVGYQVLTTSGVVGDSGKPVAVYGYAIKCGTAASAFLKSGTAVTGTMVLGDLGIANQTKSFPFYTGYVFPSGACCSFETNVTQVTVFYRQILT